VAALPPLPPPPQALLFATATGAGHDLGARACWCWRCRLSATARSARSAALAHAAPPALLSCGSLHMPQCLCGRRQNSLRRHWICGCGWLAILRTWVASLRWAHGWSSSRSSSSVVGSSSSLLCLTGTRHQVLPSLTSLPVCGSNSSSLCPARPLFIIVLTQPGCFIHGVINTAGHAFPSRSREIIAGSGSRSAGGCATVTCAAHRAVVPPLRFRLAAGAGGCCGGGSGSSFSSGCMMGTGTRDCLRQIGQLTLEEKRRVPGPTPDVNSQSFIQLQHNSWPQESTIQLSKSVS
jgi:hypothetical protein